MVENNEKREMIGEDGRKTIPVHEDCVIPERYATGRIPDITGDADGNDQVESAKVWEPGRVKKVRELQLGDPTKVPGAYGSGNGYLQNR